MKIFYGWKNAGLICFAWKHWSLHLFVQREEWVFGREDDYFDGPLWYFGAGPLFLLAWCHLPMPKR